ncbi:zf-HC2 domain-containing protein [Nocardioides speluncae]|uniref:zf-HC2 domain-containing protein n=1 Tax=Nocardioides speluncae TaxID=2670337 RepID=UPI000D687CF4|nr:zf-HC2 domain-containing protein [Nocardioides speluncae]
MLFDNHIGSRVTALIDGQLSAAEEERAWAHVHSCSSCRRLVEGEGWVKTRLSCLGMTATEQAAPDHLKGALCGAGWPMNVPAAMPVENRSRRYAGLAALGAGSAGAAMFGVLALTSPADAPVDRRLPLTSVVKSPAQQTGRTATPTPPTAWQAPARVGVGLNSLGR